MDETAEMKYTSGDKDDSLSWIQLVILDLFGIHRFYLGKWISGIIWLLTGGLFLIEWLYDLWSFNEQISEVNRDMV